MPSGCSLALFPRGQLRFEQGRFEEAAADFLQVERLSICWGAIGIPAPPARILAARALAALGDQERARPRADAALAHARHFGAPTLRLARAARVGDDDRRRRAARRAGGGGRRARRLARAARARRGARSSSAPRCAAPGATSTRAPPLREALELARRCGAVGLAKVRLRRARRDRGARPPLHPDRRRVAHAEPATRGRAGGERHDQPPDRPDAVPDRQDDRVASRRRLRQPRHPLAPAAAGGAEAGTRSDDGHTG